MFRCSFCVFLILQLLYRARGCKLPNLPLEGGGGHFTKNEVSLNYNAFENVDVVCHLDTGLAPPYQHLNLGGPFGKYPV